MAIEINKPFIVSDKQIFKFESIVVARSSDGCRADITFAIEDEKENRISEKVISYTGEDFNTFWSHFNSGKFLYEELASKENLNVEIHDSIEEEFNNLEE